MSFCLALYIVGEGSSELNLNFIKAIKFKPDWFRFWFHRSCLSTLNLPIIDKNTFQNTLRLEVNFKTHLGLDHAVKGLFHQHFVLPAFKDNGHIIMIGCLDIQRMYGHSQFLSYRFIYVLQIYTTDINLRIFLN